MRGQVTSDRPVRKRASKPAKGSCPSFQHERALRREGYRFIAGIDEAGRGAWAGPVVASAVLLPINVRCLQALRGVNDSKQLTPRQREEYRSLIQEMALAWAVGSASHTEIDAHGIIRATRLAMMRSVAALAIPPDALVIDALPLPDLDLHQDVFNYADAISLSVAAASVLAKTERDAYMRKLDETLPGYGFAIHKGYGTQSHQHALDKLGVSWAHRRSYAPIMRLCQIGPPCESTAE